MDTELQIGRKRGEKAPSVTRKQRLDNEALQELLSTLATSQSQATLPRTLQERVRNFVAHLTSLEILRVVAALGLLGFAVTLLIHYVLEAIGGAPVMCRSPVCEYYSGLLAKAMDAAADPCDDFHRHVCSGWDERHSEESFRMNAFRQYAEKLFASAERTATPASGRQDAWQKAALFYQSCRAVLAGGANEMETIKSLLPNSSVFWPEFKESSNLLRMLLSLSAKYDWAAVIHFKLVRNRKVSVSPAKFYGMIMDRRSAALRDNTKMKGYRRYFKEITRRLGTPGTTNLSFDELLSLESRVVLALQSSYSMPMGSATLYNQSLDDVIDLANSSIPKSIWQEELHVHFDMALSGPETVFTIRNLAFFSAFFNLTQSEGESNMTYYVGWVVVQGLSLLANKHVIGYYLDYLDQADTNHHHALFCGNLTHDYMGRAFYVGGLRQELRPSVSKNVSRLVRAVRTAFRERLTLSPWASALPRSGLTANSSAINSRDPSLTILAETLDADGLFERYPNMKETKIFTNMKRATAAYRMTKDDTTMPDILYDGTVRFSEIGQESFHLLPVALGLPFFNMEAPLAVSYGILGNEVSNALATVIFRRMRLATDGTSFEEVRKAIQCFSNNSAASSTADETALELARAAVSVRVLFGAFQEATKGQAPWTLSVFPSATDEQLFFRFWCFSQCGGSRAKAWCNEPLRSFRRFSESFSCKRGSAMSTVKECPVLEWFL
ncbi:uncharacterized protein LOC144180535 [Haemaphysalis longicornis]